MRRGLRLRRALLPRIAEALGKLGGALGAPVQARLAAYRRTTGIEAASGTADPCAVVRLGLAGSDASVLADVDVVLALALVDRALGGSGEEPGAIRRPNVAERAVLALLAARVLATAQGEGALRILGVAADPQGVRVALGSDGAAVHVFEVLVSCDATRGLVRFLVPEPLVARAPRSANVAPAPFETARLESVRVPLRAIAGWTSLGPSDVARIEVGDVVLLDEATARPGRSGVAGKVGLRLPRGRHTRLRCGLDGARLIVEDVDLSEEVPMQGTAKGSGGNGGALLAEVPVEVLVEIGRVEISARELVDLGAGDTLVLDRRPGDPVDLRAGDRLLARGELVEVDGKIGVHVLEVVR